MVSRVRLLSLATLASFTLFSGSKMELLAAGFAQHVAEAKPRTLLEAQGSGQGSSQVLPPGGVRGREAADDGPPHRARSMPLVVAGLNSLRSALGFPAGAIVLCSALLLLGLLVLWPRFGTRSLLWVGIFGLGSPAWAHAWYQLPELATAVGVALAVALIWGERGRGGEGISDVYTGSLRPGRSTWRWLASGLGLGAALSIEPLLVPLAVPILMARPKGAARFQATSAFLLGAAAPVTLEFLFGASQWTFQPVWDGGLFAWNVAFLLVGSQTGILIHYPGVLLQASGPSPDRARAWIPLAVLATALLAIGFRPFDWSGPEGWSGFPAFLPLLVPLLVALPQRASSWFGVCLGISGFFISIRTHAPLDMARFQPVQVVIQGVDELLAWLPDASTLRSLPGSAPKRVSNVVWQVVGPGQERGHGKAEGERGEFSQLHHFRRARLLIWSPPEVNRVRLELGPNAPSAIAVEGALLGGTLFRPSGEIGFELLLDRPRRRHPVWWSRRVVAVHRLDVDLGEKAQVPVKVGLTLLAPRPTSGP